MAAAKPLEAETRRRHYGGGMNIQVDTLEYASALEQAGIARAHAEAIAKLQARTVRDLVDHELVTKEFLRAELRSEITELRSELRDEFRAQISRLEPQIRALQYGAAIAAFVISLVVLLSRLIT
jgi:hypothetical protein